MVKGDPERIAQVFRNLLDNAVKYTPAAGTITARLSVEQDRALFVVEDTGPGIAQDFYPHLFELFRQQEESLTRQHRGLGLGLALVKHIAELHGGMAWADPPAAGKGACFRVSLPLMRE
jgi:signal transduction histidine kinase